MTDKDADAASRALLVWLESQDIHIADAARVLTMCLVAVIHEISVTRGLNPKDGGRVIADIIVESLP